MLVWGWIGLPRADQGGRYDPETDSWEPVTGDNSAAGTNGHVTVGTGGHLILWSGTNGTYVDFGSVYDPMTDTWVRTTMTNAPTPREEAAAVWTGSEMLVWGGYDGENLNTGGRYRPTQTDGDVDGFTVCQDCDDAQSCVSPGHEELCDGFNNDCDSAGWPLRAADESDADGDGYLACGTFDPTTCAAPGIIGGRDCDDAGPDTFPGAIETNDGIDNQCPGDSGFGVSDELSGDSGFHDPANLAEYSWVPQAGATRYQLRRSTTPDFSADCVGGATSMTSWVDPGRPDRAAVFFYLSRPSMPNGGSWGQDSAGGERLGGCL